MVLCCVLTHLYPSLLPRAVLAKNPLATPAPGPAQAAATPAAGALNFYGSNEGLLVRERADAHEMETSATDSGASSDEEPAVPLTIEGVRLQLRRRRGAAAGPRSAAALDQDAYMEQLEDENLR